MRKGLIVLFILVSYCSYASENSHDMECKPVVKESVFADRAVLRCENTEVICYMKMRGGGMHCKFKKGGK